MSPCVEPTVMGPRSLVRVLPVWLLSHWVGDMSGAKQTFEPINIEVNTTLASTLDQRMFRGRFVSHVMASRDI